MAIKISSKTGSITCDNADEAVKIIAALNRPKAPTVTVRAPPPARQKRRGHGLTRTGAFQYRRVIEVNQDGTWVEACRSHTRHLDPTINDIIVRDNKVKRSVKLGRVSQYIINNYRPGTMRITFFDRKGNRVGVAA